MIKRIKLLIAVLAMLVLPLITTGKAIAYAPTVSLADEPIQSIVTYFANQNSVDPNLAISVMECESHGIQSTSSDKGLSNGIFQIQKATWDMFTQKMGVTLNYNSPMDQAEVATWAFAHGYGNQWTTYVAIQKGGSYTFYDRLEGKYMTVHCNLQNTV